MDAATLQSRIYSGYAKAAKRIGYSFDIYRPSAAVTPPPLDPSNKIQTAIPASFTLGKGTGFPYEKTGAHDDLLWHCLVDGGLTRPGDYLFNATHGTYFVAAMQDELPVLTVLCPRTISITRQACKTAAGTNTYGGLNPATDVTVMAGWPAGTRMRGRGIGGVDVGLPSDIALAGFEFFFPLSPGVFIAPSDIITDDLGRRFSIWGAELSALGWRVMTRQDFV